MTTGSSITASDNETGLTWEVPGALNSEQAPKPNAPSRLPVSAGDKSCH